MRGGRKQGREGERERAVRERGREGEREGGVRGNETEMG